MAEIINHLRVVVDADATRISLADIVGHSGELGLGPRSPVGEDTLVHISRGTRTVPCGRKLFKAVTAVVKYKYRQAAGIIEGTGGEGAINRILGIFKIDNNPHVKIFATHNFRKSIIDLPFKVFIVYISLLPLGEGGLVDITCLGCQWQSQTGYQY